MEDQSTDIGSIPGHEFMNLIHRRTKEIYRLQSAKASETPVNREVSTAKADSIPPDSPRDVGAASDDKDELRQNVLAQSVVVEMTKGYRM